MRDPLSRRRIVDEFVCEIDSPEAEKVLADNTVVLYIRADEDMEQELIRRAASNPKPMYYNEEFLKHQLEVYLELESLRSVDELDPKKFARWIFPELVREIFRTSSQIATGLIRSLTRIRHFSETPLFPQASFTV